jgi:hypothetical protein
MDVTGPLHTSMPSSSNFTCRLQACQLLTHHHTYQHIKLFTYHPASLPAEYAGTGNPLESGLEVTQGHFHANELPNLRTDTL